MTPAPVRLRPGIGTGLGTLPGVDPREAVAMMCGETDFPFLPELPARGPGADSIGRAGAILIDMPFELVHETYRFTTRPSQVTRQARDFLSRDLDALEERWDELDWIDTYHPLKVQLCGPFTFTANVELRNGHKVARDHGARLDVVASMIDGIGEHVRELRRRLGADVVVQLDEPDLIHALNGSITPLTRMDPIPPAPVHQVADQFEKMAAGIGVPMVLHTGGRPQVDLCHLLSTYAITVDMSIEMTAEELDCLGAFLDGGGVLVAGAVPGVEPDEPIRAEEIAQGLAAIVDRIGVGREVLRDSFVVTPSAELASASPAWAAQALGLASRTAELLTQDPSAL